MEIILALAGIIIPAIIGYGVYIYRPQIGYKVQGSSGSFLGQRDQIVHCHDSSGIKIEIGNIELRNDTRTDVENFKITFEAHGVIPRFEVASTISLAKSAVNFPHEDDEISIYLERFPAKECITLSYSSIGKYGEIGKNPKKVSGKFNLYSVDFHNRQKKILASIFGFLANVIIIIFGIIIIFK